MSIKRRAFLGGALSSASILAAQSKRESSSEARAGSGIKTREPRVITRFLKDAGAIPNNRLPLVIYQNTLVLNNEDNAVAIEALLHSYDWGGNWRNGIFTFHHYHSTAHEALFIYGGSAKVQMGGEPGIIETVSAGDVIIIPAGVGHKNLGSTDDFKVIGCYPPGQKVDMQYGKPGERPGTDQTIAKLALPTADPVFGAKGPLLEHWRPA